MREEEAHGIVLWASVFRETDRLAFFYTFEKGKIKLRVRGARRPTSRLSALCAPGSQVVLRWAKTKKSPSLLIGGRVLHHRKILGENWQGLFFPQALADIVLHGTAWEDPDPKLYALLERAWERAQDRPKEILETLVRFIVRFLAVQGLPFQVKRCAACAKPPPPWDGRLSWLHGGWVCRSCAGRSPGVPFSGEALSAWRVLSGDPGAGRVSEKAWGDLYVTLGNYLEHVLEKEIPSLAVFRRLSAGEIKPLSKEP